jgi:hypothetical protein
LSIEVDPAYLEQIVRKREVAETRVCAREPAPDYGDEKEEQKESDEARSDLEQESSSHI